MHCIYVCRFLASFFFLRYIVYLCKPSLLVLKIPKKSSLLGSFQCLILNILFLTLHPLCAFDIFRYSRSFRWLYYTHVFTKIQTHFVHIHAIISIDKAIESRNIANIYTFIHDDHLNCQVNHYILIEYNLLRVFYVYAIDIQYQGLTHRNCII